MIDFKSYSIWMCLGLMLVLASCGSRKNVNTNAAKAAEAMSNLKSKKLYNFITDWTGVKYRIGGLDKQGIDCSGFAYLLEKEIFNETLPRRSRDQATAVKSRNIGKLKEGDLIFFSFGGNGVDHVGVYLNGDYFVHASTTRGVMVDDFTQPWYQKYIVKTGTLK